MYEYIQSKYIYSIDRCTYSILYAPQARKLCMGIQCKKYLQYSRACGGDYLGFEFSFPMLHVIETVEQQPAGPKAQ